MADELQAAINESIVNGTVVDQATAKLRALQAAGNLTTTTTIRVETQGVQGAIDDLEKVAITADEVARRRAQIYGPRAGRTLPSSLPIIPASAGESAEELERAVNQQFLLAKEQLAEAQRATKFQAFRNKYNAADIFQSNRGFVGLLPQEVIAQEREQLESQAESQLARQLRSKSIFHGAPFSSQTNIDLEAEQALYRSRVDAANEVYARQLRRVDIFNGASLANQATLGATPEEESNLRKFRQFDKATPSYIEQGEREENYSKLLRRNGDIFNGAPPQYPTGGGDEGGGGGFFGRFGKRIQGLAFYLGAAAILYPISSAIFQASENAAKLETTLIHIQGILGSQSLADKIAVRQEIVDIADRYKLDITQVAEAAEKFAQQGDSIGKIGQDLQTAAIGAQALGINIDRAQELITSVQNITGNQAAGEGLFDKIFAVRRGSPVTPDTLIQGLEQLLPLVAQLRGQYNGLISDSDLVLGAVSTVSKETNASSATSLRFVLGRLGNQSTVSRVEALTGVGFGTAESGGTQLRSLVNILGDLAAAYHKLESAHDPRALQLLQELAGSRQTRDVAVLLNNWKDVMQTVERSAYSMGEAVGQAGRQLDSVQNRIQQTKNNLTAFAESMLENSVIGGALKGTLSIVNFGLEQLNGNAAQVILTLLTVTGVVIGLTYALKALRTSALTGGITSLLGLESAGAGATVIAFGEIAAAIAAIGLAIAGVVVTIKALTTSGIDTSSLAVQFADKSSLVGQGQQHLDEFSTLASAIGVSQQSLYSTLTSAAELSTAKFRDATGAINTTRKAFVDDFLGQVIKLSPEAGKFINTLVEGLSPSEAASQRLSIAQDFIGRIAYLSNAIGNVHFNQISEAGQSLINNVTSEASKLPALLGGSRTTTQFSSLTGAAGLVPGAVTSTQASPQDLFNESIRGLDNLSAPVRTVSTIILETAKGMGVLDGALKELNSTAGEGKDIWEVYAQRLKQVVEGTTSGPILINKVSDALKTAFIKDPQAFSKNILGLDNDSAQKGATDLGAVLSEFLTKVLANLKGKLTQDQFAALTKNVDEFLRKDKGVAALFESFSRGATLANDPIYKFLENMYLTERAIDQNVEAAKRLGLAYDVAGARVTALQEINKQFSELPLTAFKDYLNQLQIVNQLWADKEQLTRISNVSNFIIPPAILASLGIQVDPNHPEATQGIITGAKDTAQRRYDEALKRLSTSGAAISVLENFDASGISNTVSRLQSVGPPNPELTRFQAFLQQFAIDQSSLKGLKPNTPEFRAAAKKLVEEFLRLIQENFTSAFVSAVSDENVYQQNLLDITTAANIRKTQISSFGNVQKGYIGNQLAAIAGPDILDRLDAIKQEADLNVTLAQLERQSALQTISQQRGINGANPTELDARTRAAEAAFQEATAKAQTLSIEQQLLAIDKEITQNQEDYNKQVEANAKARLSGLRDVLLDINKLTKGKEVQTILGGVGKSFYERGVDNLLSAFSPSKGVGVFRSIGTFLGGAGEPDPITQAHANGGQIVKQAIIQGHSIGAGFFGKGPGVSVGGLGSDVIPTLGTDSNGNPVDLPFTHDTIDNLGKPNFVQAQLDAAGENLSKLIAKQDTQKALLGLGTAAGVLGGEFAGEKRLGNTRISGANSQAGSQIGSLLGQAGAKALLPASVAAGSTLGTVVPVVGTIVGGLLGGLIGGLFDHPKPNPIEAHLSRIEGNTKDQVNLLQNTNKLLEASGLNFNVSSSFRLPRYGVDTFIGGGAGNRGTAGFVSAGTASVSNAISVQVSIGNTNASASDIGKMVAQAVSDRLESEYSTGGRYVSTRTRY